MISGRDYTMVIRNQFNIHGSRGKDAGKFVSDYVSRNSATEPSLAYQPNPNEVPVQGDGVAFTLDQTAISRKETLRVAEHVQELHATGKRAIQQMVISFDPDYLIDQKLVPDDIEVFRKGDYQGQYDDVRLRNAVRTGLQALVDEEGYRDGKAIACIQWDTKHLHVHAVVYEDAPQIARMRGNEEKGVIKASSFNQMAYDMNRKLTLTKPLELVPNRKNLIPEDVEEVDVKKHDDQAEMAPMVNTEFSEPVYVTRYLKLIQEKQEAAKEAARQYAEELKEQISETNTEEQHEAPQIEINPEGLNDNNGLQQ